MYYADKYMWGVIKPGATLRGLGWTGDDKVGEFCGPQIRHRIEIDSWVHGAGDYASTVLTQDVTNITGGTAKNQNEKCYQWIVDMNDVEVIKFPPVKRDFTNQVTAGSVWRFKTDWTFSGYGHGKVTDTYTVPAGTEIKVKGNKLPNESFGKSLEKCIPVSEPIPGIPTTYDIWDNPYNQMCLPIKEVWTYLELVTPGRKKVFWKLEDEAGKELLKKRYKTVGNLKAAIRVRGGLVKDNDDDSSDAIPEWIDDNSWMEQIDMSNGMVAVEYDTATKKELRREDMLEYFTMAKLKV